MIEIKASETHRTYHELMDKIRYYMKDTDTLHVSHCHCFFNTLQHPAKLKFSRFEMDQASSIH